MGNRKNFVASVKSKIARALAKLFPAYAVRKKTLLTNPNANDWVVADVDQAMYLIKKLKFSEREIAERTWSSATRMELLSKSDSKGRKALANTVRNENDTKRQVADLPVYFSYRKNPVHWNWYRRCRKIIIN